MIKEFYIDGLYDERDVKIPFNGEYKIIVAKNGYGKTTILNSFYALLSGDISKLRKIGFKKIGIKFEDGVDISFEKSDFDADLESIKGHPLFSHLESKLGRDFILELLDDIRRFPPSMIESSPLFRRASKALDYPTRILREYLSDFRLNKDRKNINSKTKAKLTTLKAKFPYKSLYLPTYRRVEEDIRAFGAISDDETDGHSSINFGMSDVNKSIKSITSEILSSSVEWFSKINGQMLSQLVNGFEVTDEMKNSISEPRSVEIVLERIGKNISISHKEQILNLVRSGEILKDHDPLVYFVANLLSVYEQQQENDQAIQSFTKVSNKYLNDKEVVYNESNVTIEIVRKKNRRPVDIESLSSGEKQIISLFALLYLQKKNDLAIFFDEPELSLSIEWQKTLLPDIVDSGKCKFLFCTTHSPFIFENELERVTVDLAMYIKEL
ncbi:AAA family ATPase [Janthinobacterium sp. B9-8]|uniref:AAA family ATPase n=1 Tax=Janthinobacterium sp. B9-8 TaxID=1236179 RepID=UPI00061D176F|nr:AAA family ATPase [Janthinobacterium sp. B9-8]AMC33764.1 ATP/GTP-binding protein [Janthinobacterium sp. B9-8]